MQTCRVGGKGRGKGWVAAAGGLLVAIAGIVQCFLCRDSVDSPVEFVL